MADEPKMRPKRDPDFFAAELMPGLIARSVLEPKPFAEGS
jgi:hypothetical protein